MRVASALACVLVGLVLAHETRAVTANPGAYGFVYTAEDAFRNWDFHCSAAGCIDPANVDWPMALLFYNNAEINKLKDNILEARYPAGAACATPQYARLNDGAGWNWDGDRGKKTTCCPGAGWPVPDTADHIRFYSAGAASHDRMYNTAWGYWIVASAHQDHVEPACRPYGTPWYGYSETAEGNLFAYWTSTLGRPAWRNHQYWGNAQNVDQGNHRIRNNGYASVFWVW